MAQKYKKKRKIPHFFKKKSVFSFFFHIFAVKLPN